VASLVRLIDFGVVGIVLIRAPLVPEATRNWRIIIVLLGRPDSPLSSSSARICFFCFAGPHTARKHIDVKASGALRAFGNYASCRVVHRERGPDLERIAARIDLQIGFALM